MIIALSWNEHAITFHIFFCSWNPTLLKRKGKSQRLISVPVDKVKVTVKHKIKTEIQSFIMFLVIMRPQCFLEKKWFLDTCISMGKINSLEPQGPCY